MKHTLATNATANKLLLQRVVAVLFGQICLTDDFIQHAHMLQHQGKNVCINSSVFDRSSFFFSLCCSLFRTSTIRKIIEQWIYRVAAIHSYYNLISYYILSLCLWKKNSCGRNANWFFECGEPLKRCANWPFRLHNTKWIYKKLFYINCLDFEESLSF